MNNDFSEFIKEIERSTEIPEPPEDNWEKGEIPSLPKYKKETINSEYYGKPTEGRTITEGNISLEGFRCRACGTLQWTGIWRKLRKERCQKCEGLLEFNSQEEFLKDWKDHWEFKPMENYMTKWLSNGLKKLMRDVSGTNQ